MKKLSFLLALCLLFVCVSLPVNASIFNGKVFDGIEYSYFNGKYSVVAFTDDVPENIVILSNINGTPVTSIYSDALYHCPAKAIFIPDSITHVGSFAFSNDSIKNIYCEAPSKPSGWDSSWKAFWNSAKVHWGASVDDMLFASSENDTPEVKAAKEELKNIKNTANSLNSDDYTGDSWANLQNALDFSPAGKTADEINQAVANIQTAMDELELSENATYLLGDVNLNGDIDARDYLLLKRGYFGTYNLIPIAKAAGDINGNGKLDARDYLLLKRAYFGTYTI